MAPCGVNSPVLGDAETLKVRYFIFGTPEHGKQTRRKKTGFFFSVYNIAITPNGEIEVLMKHIRQAEAACVCVGRGVSVCANETQSAFYPNKVLLPGGDVPFH